MTGMRSPVMPSVIFGIVLAIAVPPASGALGKFTFQNDTKKEIHVFAKLGNGLAPFRLEPGKAHTVTNDTVSWGWRFHPPEGETNTDWKTPCSRTVANDRTRTIHIVTGDECYID